MKLISTAIPLVALISVTSVVSVNVLYGSQYDNSIGRPTSVRCFEDGPLTGASIFHDVKTFPYIGGANFVVKNTSGCGTCWKITNGANSVIVTVVDKAEADFSLSLQAMNDLTNGNGQNGPITGASATKIDGRSCGL